MQSIDFNSLGDNCKSFENLTACHKLMPGVPIIARMDGRAFHTLTRNADKPYDYELIDAMRTTTKALVKEFNADIGFVQSDEITLVWLNLEMFDLKIQKLNSILAATTTALFNKAIVNTKFKDFLPVFDSRIWNVPSIDCVVDNLMWRQWDAYKNSVSMAAYNLIPQKELHKINTKGKLAKLQDIGFDWYELPHYAKRGSFYKKYSTFKCLSVDELSKIPEKHRPEGPIHRNVIGELYVGALTQVTNKIGVLFNNEPGIKYHDESIDVDIVEQLHNNNLRAVLPNSGEVYRYLAIRGIYNPNELQDVYVVHLFDEGWWWLEHDSKITIIHKD
jgi:tRNA(His) guanylyltransferase